MAATKYISIDKNFIEEGIRLNFDLFIALNSNKEVSCIKKNGLYITNDDKITIDAAHLLYVQEDEYPNYERFQKKFLHIQPKNEQISISEQIAKIYVNASNVLDDLFKNPETLGNYKASKAIVSEIIDIILRNDFTIKFLLDIASHDYYTHTHSINVAIYSLSLGTCLGLSKKQLWELGEAALLHDLGKSKIDSAIINKNGRLSDVEFNEIKKHPMHGYTIGLKLGIKNRAILQGIRHHHEKMDGSGYPSGMRGEAIPLYARIICLCDIFDALTSKRSYKKPMSTFDTLKLLKIQMNKDIDLNILNQMIVMFRK